jgi:hypothetical protein
VGNDFGEPPQSEPSTGDGVGPLEALAVFAFLFLAGLPSAIYLG